MKLTDHTNVEVTGESRSSEVAAEFCLVLYRSAGTRPAALARATTFCSYGTSKFRKSFFSICVKVETWFLGHL